MRLFQDFEHLLGFGPLTSGCGACGFPESITRAEEGLEMAAFDLCFFQTSRVSLTLVFRKVESRTTNTFKSILAQLMKETEELAKNVSEELGKSVLTQGEMLSLSEPNSSF